MNIAIQDESKGLCYGDHIITMYMSISYDHL